MKSSRIGCKSARADLSGVGFLAGFAPVWTAFAAGFPMWVVLVWFFWVVLRAC